MACSLTRKTFTPSAAAGFSLSRTAWQHAPFSSGAATRKQQAGEDERGSPREAAPRSNGSCPRRAQLDHHAHAGR